MKNKLCELVDEMCSAVEKIGVMGGLDGGVGKAARIELGMFMMYLSASDGEISWDEAKVISDICSLNLTPANLGQFIRENNIYSTEFEQKVPVSFQIMVTADNKFLEMGNEVSGSDAVLSTYKAVGEYLIKADGNVDENEVNDYKIYINMLEEYRDKNYKGVNSLTTGFVKNKGMATKAPVKNGVAAPRKG